METFKEQLKISIFGNTQNECLPYNKVEKSQLYVISLLLFLRRETYD